MLGNSVWLWPSLIIRSFIADTIPCMRNEKPTIRVKFQVQLMVQIISAVLTKGMAVRLEESLNTSKREVRGKWVSACSASALPVSRARHKGRQGAQSCIADCKACFHLHWSVSAISQHTSSLNSYRNPQRKTSMSSL